MPTVNARDLLAFLQVGKDFPTWIKDRVEQYCFSEGQDFVTAPELRSPKAGSAMARPQRSIAYHLSLDMAKEMAMVERTERGKVARHYFLECERQAKAQATAVNPASLSRLQLIQMAMQAEEERLALENKVQARAPKAEALDRSSKADGSMCLTRATKSLSMRRNDFMLWMQEHQWTFGRHPVSPWLCNQVSIHSGLLEHKVTTVERSDGSEKVVEQCLVTAKGIAKLSELFNVRGADAA